jgi:putative nucleotidyltransferase with HDIG domain
MISLPPDIIEQLKQTQQNPRYHAEGNVYNHTLMVLEHAEEYCAKNSVSLEEEKVLKWGALLHDLGKIEVTKWHNGKWSARGHERAGVSWARNILLQQTDISLSERQKILAITRWHHLPLRWITGEITYEELHNWASQTDLALIGKFAFFDFKGRLCEDKAQLLYRGQEFVDEIVPEMLQSIGSFEQAQAAYSSKSLPHKRACWNAYKMQNIDCWQKLLQKPSPEYKTAAFKAILSIGTPKSGKSKYLTDKYPDSLHISLAKWEMDGTLPSDPFNRQRILTAFKYHISVYSRHHAHLILDGNNLDTDARQMVAEIIRELNGHLTYLIFERTLAENLALNEKSEKPLPESDIILAYRNFHYPHPWEADECQWAENEQTTLQIF